MNNRRLHISERFTIGAFVCSFLIALVVVRMLYLETYRYKYLYTQSENNRIRVQPIMPKRGRLLDREHRVLVTDRPSYTLSVVPAEVANSSTVTLLASLLSTDESVIRKQIKKTQAGRYRPALVQRDIPFEDVAVLEEQNERYPGAIYSKDQVRKYSDSLATECFTGYVGEISPEELPKLDPSIYQAGRLIGKAGLEKQYDRLLRGIEGTEYLEVTASGQLLGEVLNQPAVPPEPGSDLVLTIDKDIQQAATASFGTFCCGAVVAMDPRNGEILAMVSNPPSDANQFSAVMSDSLWRSILADSTNPLLNRPLDGLYPPGSTYKLVIAGAALERGVIDRNTLMPSGCSGAYRFGNRVFHCWQPGGHGRLNVIGAIEQSCDVYFYQLGYKLGLSDYTYYSTACGFGKKTGIDLPQEAAGHVPSKDWYDKRFGKNKWSPALILNLAIGQGEILVTPLQLTQFYSGIANNGKVYKPHLVRSIIGPDGRETLRGGELAFTLPFSEETLRILKEGLIAVVNGPSGTARGARIGGITVGGKTGTAQNPHGENHAWFVGFAPVENPEIVACVLVENAGHGSTWAAPAVRNILEAYLKMRHLINAEIAVVEAL